MGAADAALLESAVRRLGDAEAGDSVIDHHCSGLDACGQRFATPAIAGPDAGSQSELAVIRQPHCVVIGVERSHGQRRPERLLPHDAHVLRYIRQKRGSVEIRAQFREATSAGQQSRSSCHRIVHMVFHRAQLALVNEWSHFDLGT